jgi:hypothetical protein
MGLLPILSGLRRIWTLWADRHKEHDETPNTEGAGGATVAVIIVTVANGGDNIGVYTPVFATHFGPEIIVVAGAFRGDDRRLVGSGAFAGQPTPAWRTDPALRKKGGALRLNRAGLLMLYLLTGRTQG